RAEAERGAGGDMCPIAFEIAFERRGSGRSEIDFARQFQRLAQLMVVLLVAERQVLVEPFGGERLSRYAQRFASVVKQDTHAHDRLAAVRGGLHAEAERHAQVIGALPALDCDKPDADAAHASACSLCAGALSPRPVRMS